MGNVANGLTKDVEGPLPDIFTVNLNPALVNIKQAGNHVHQGRFPGSCPSHNGQSTPRRDVHVDVLKRFDPIVGVGESHAPEGDSSLDTRCFSRYALTRGNRGIRVEYLIQAAHGRSRPLDHCNDESHGSDGPRHQGHIYNVLCNITDRDLPCHSQ